MLNCELNPSGYCVNKAMGFYKTPTSQHTLCSSLFTKSFMEANSQAQSLIRGKRTKRQRPLSPISMAMPYSSSSSTNHSLHHLALTRCRTEEEDIAHCLILLAQGPSQKPKLELPASGTPRFGDFKVVCGVGLFSQNRAKQIIETEQNRASKPNTTTTTLTLRTPNRVDDSIKSKVHECVVCGAKFGSGQALGGHMRRHRAKTTSLSGTSPKQMDLDLNLPPPPEDYRREQNLSFSTAMSPLVDCFHY